MTDASKKTTASLSRSFTTRRLAIRAIQESIADLSPWMDWPHPCPDVQQSTTYCRYAQDAFDQRVEFSCLIFRRKDETLLGSVRLARPNWEIPCIELGYWIRTPFVGKGYITEVAVELAPPGIL